MRRMWHGLQTITDFKKKTSPDKLNNLFVRFEDNIVPPTWPTTKECRLSFNVADVSKTFTRVNPRKAAGPDGIPSRVLGEYADQLAGVFPDIFNLSLSQPAVPILFKISSIVLFPRKLR